MSAANETALVSAVVPDPAESTPQLIPSPPNIIINTYTSCLWRPDEIVRMQFYGHDRAHKVYGRGKSRPTLDIEANCFGDNPSIDKYGENWKFAREI